MPELFPFSYFAFSLLKFRKVVKDIKNINIFDKTRTHRVDFGAESFLQKSSHDAVITIFILAQKGKMASETPFGTRELMVHMVLMA